MDFALVLLIAGSVAAGVLGAVARGWSIHSRLYSLEDRLAVVEGTVSREVKVRAATARWQKPSKDEELVAAALAKPHAPEHKANWWELPNVPRSFTG